MNCLPVNRTPPPLSDGGTCCSSSIHTAHKFSDLRSTNAQQRLLRSKTDDLQNFMALLTTPLLKTDLSENF